MATATIPFVSSESQSQNLSPRGRHWPGMSALLDFVNDAMLRAVQHHPENSLPLLVQAVAARAFDDAADDSDSQIEQIQEWAMAARCTSVQTDAFQTSGSSPQSTPPVDLIFENHFSLFLIRPVSPAGQSWLDENVGDENTQTFGGAVVCEPRYVEAIYHGAIESGLGVRA